MTQPRTVAPPSLRAMALTHPHSGNPPALTVAQAEHLCEQLAHELTRSMRIPVKANVAKDEHGMTIRLTYTRPHPTSPAG